MDPIIEAMFTAGAHFGYSKSRRHPSTAKFIFGNKNKVDIIDLEKTNTLLSEALAFIQNLAASGKQILLVGVKPEAKQAIVRTAVALEMPYVSERWVGGILTNFSEVKKRITRLEELRKQKENGELEKYTKKEQLLIDEEIVRMEKFFAGLVSLKKMPDAVFVIDPRREHIAVEESKKMGIPVIALGSTDCNMSIVDFPIIANDGAVSSIDFFMNTVKDAYEGSKQTTPKA